MSQNAKPSNQKGKEVEHAIEIPHDPASLPASWARCCIYRVPRKLRGPNEQTYAHYTPQTISIGPFHRRDKKLEAMNIHKQRYLKEFCRRTEKELDDIRGRVEKQVVDIQHCYGETFEPWNEKLVNMIVEDSVFIIELFLKSSQPDSYKRDFILAKPWLRLAVRQDLILLENQLPYFLLEDLYNFAVPEDNDRQHSFYELTCIYLHKYIHKPKEQEGTYYETREEFHERLKESLGLAKKFHNEKNHHFLDIIRNFLTDKHPKLEVTSEVIENQYTATKLSNVGLKFRVDPNAWPLNVDFKDGVLKMPKLIIDDSTETFIRNLMAFEQCHYPDQAYVCNYYMLLNSLINNEDDIDVLIHNRVIINTLGYEKAASNVVNSVCKQIVKTKFCYNDISKKLSDRYRNPVSRTLAILKSVYFSNLWRGTGTVAALVLLFLTLIQSVDSIMKMF